jgi:hypothetical protein
VNVKLKYKQMNSHLPKKKTVQKKNFLYWYRPMCRPSCNAGPNTTDWPVLGFILSNIFTALVSVHVSIVE